MKTGAVLTLLLSAPALALGGEALSGLGDASAVEMSAAGAPVMQAGGRAASSVDAAPVDANVNDAARQLYNRLRSQFGSYMFAGQTTQYFAELVRMTGKRPVVRAFDLQNYSPHNPWYNWAAHEDGTVQAAIDWHKSTGGRGIVTFQWHWFSPSGGALRKSTFYTRDTSFDVSKAVIEGTEEHTQVLRDIDAIAVQLKRLRDAGVPVLWRPLHEAGGKWFWWGAKGPENCKKLYYLMFNRLVFHHGLHNLLWVWATPEHAWYPGNDHVDVAGFDSYPGPYIHAPQKSTFDSLRKLTKGKKILALTETGPLPDPERCFKEGAPWAYFVAWSNLVASQNTPFDIYSFFRKDRVVTLD